jgi:hypothetical protein
MVWDFVKLNDFKFQLAIVVIEMQGLFLKWPWKRPFHNVIVFEPVWLFKLHFENSTSSNVSIRILDAVFVRNLLKFVVHYIAVMNCKVKQLHLPLMGRGGINGIMSLVLPYTRLMHSKVLVCFSCFFIIRSRWIPFMKF